MIFATVGTQLPFDRLIQALDGWAQNHRETKVFAQVGGQGAAPSSIDFAYNLTPSQFEKAIAKCKMVIAHAGMGSVLTALRARKPLIVMPRQSAFGEHRNDHQMATARKLRGLPGIRVAEDEKALVRLLSQPSRPQTEPSVGPFANPAMIGAVAEFIYSGEVRP